MTASSPERQERERIGPLWTPPSNKDIEPKTPPGVDAVDVSNGRQRYLRIPAFLQSAFSIGCHSAYFASSFACSSAALTSPA
jgi:hypothetical protein